MSSNTENTTNQFDSSERDRLAGERTSLANERTFLAYVRTAIMLFATGATLVKLFSASMYNITIGVIFVCFSLFLLVVGVFRFKRMKRRIIENK